EQLDASMAPEVVAQFAIMQPVKAAHYTTHAQFSPPDTILALPAPPADLALVRTMYHYARATAFARKNDAAAARREIDALTALARDTDFKPFEESGIPAKDILETQRLVAARTTDRLQAVRGVGHSGEGHHRDRAPGRHRPDGRCQRRPRGRRQGL